MVWDAETTRRPSDVSWRHLTMSVWPDSTRTRSPDATFQTLRPFGAQIPSLAVLQVCKSACALTQAARDSLPALLSKLW